MAEPLSVVASGIAVAQLAGSAFTAALKLKELWDQIEGSHDTIQDLVDRIEYFGHALYDAEQTFCNPGLPAIVWDDTNAQRSVRYCQKVLQSLTEVVDDLAAQIGSAKKVRKAVGKIKVVFKKKQLDELEARLTRAVSMLQMAQSGYFAAQLRLQPDIIVAKLQTAIANPTAPGLLACAAPDGRVSLMKDDEKSEDIVNSKQLELRGDDCTAIAPKLRSRERQHPTSTREYTATFIPPLWLASWMYAWNLTLRQSYSGWDANIRYYSIRPSNSPCFKAVQEGDLELLQRLLSTGQARLDDQDEDGQSLLCHSMLFSRDVSVTMYLLNAGSRPDYENARALWLLITDLFFRSLQYRWSGAREMQIFEQLKTAGLFSGRETYLPDSDDGDDKVNYECNCPCVADASNFRTKQAVACPWHARATFKSKLERVQWYVWSSNSEPELEVVEQMLSPEWERARQPLCDDDRSNVTVPLFYTMALSLGYICSPYRSFRRYRTRRITNYSHGSQRNSRSFPWVSALSGMVPYLQSLHRVCSLNIVQFSGLFISFRGTALTWALASCLGYRWWSRTHILGVLGEWLLILQKAGVDLCEYEAEENVVLSEDNGLVWTGRNWDWGDRFDEGPVVRVLGVKVGPDINNCDVFFIEPLHDYSSDFWALIEGNPVGGEAFNIPGAWIEEDSLT